jgi:hypothetical protein
LESKREVQEFYAIAWDVLLSGLPDEDVRKKGSAVLGGVFEAKSFFGAMTKFTENQHGADWHPVPVEFRLTGLQFYPTTKTGGLVTIREPP